MSVKLTTAKYWRLLALELAMLGIVQSSTAGPPTSEPATKPASKVINGINALGGAGPGYVPRRERGRSTSRPATTRAAAEADARVINGIEKINARDEKPQFPVAVSAVEGDVVGPNQQQIHLTIDPQGAQDVSVSATATDGVEITGGQIIWQVPSSGPTTHTLTVGSTGAGDHRLILRIQATFRGGKKGAGVMAFTLDKEAHAQKMKELPPGATKVDIAGGKSLIETRGADR